MTRVADLLLGVLAGRLPAGVTDRRANWIEVARTDVSRAYRSPLLWGLCGLFAVLLLVPAARYVLFPPRGWDPVMLVLGWMDLLTRWIVPLTALVVGGQAVVGEREAGTLRVLLGLPITRRDLLVGMLLGRLVVVGALVTTGFAIAGVALAVIYVGFDPGTYATFVARKLVLGSIFVGVGVGLSALFRSRARATGAAVGVFALVGLAWRAVPDGVFYLVRGQYPENVPPPWEPPGWYVFLGNTNPLYGLDAIVDEWLYAAPGRTGTLEYRNHLIESAEPFYLQPEFMAVVMALWPAVPLLVGTWRFSRSDLA